ncbi:hypothetical protein V6N11_012182 [Hibiscus sabdariffa]|uniref:Uncharacterized protein n=1 Tax=Hibiscus sabdariffa TaxID=183260 RepID=A0ABR2QAB7_9ROSI
MLVEVWHAVKKTYAFEKKLMEVCHAANEEKNAFEKMLVEVCHVVKKMHVFVNMLMEVCYAVKKMHVFVKMLVFAANRKKPQKLGPHVSHEHLNL